MNKQSFKNFIHHPVTWMVAAALFSFILSVSLFFIQLQNNAPPLVGKVVSLTKSVLVISDARGRTATFEITPETESNVSITGIESGMFVRVKRDKKYEEGKRAKEINVVHRPKNREDNHRKP